MRRPLKTYSHLAGARRMPTEYELLSTGLLYQGARGSEVRVPLADFYAEHRDRCALTCDDWERFHDPAELTYASYVASQSKRECYVDGLLESMSHRAHATNRSTTWRDRLRYLLALRYPFHGLQMLAAYLGSMAPSGKIAIAASFQAANEMRRVQRVAYIMAQHREHDPTLGDDGPALWREDAALQPLRELIERALVAFDFGEAFVAVNLCAKPLLDELALVCFAEEARANDAPLLAEVLGSLMHDARYQQAWTRALVRMLIGSNETNHGVIAAWVRTWWPRARGAVLALAPALVGDSTHSRILQLDTSHASLLTSCGIGEKHTHGGAV